MKIPRLLAALGMLVGLCACSTVNTRIVEHHDAYATSTPRDQFLMRRGLVSVGFTAEKVLIALDKPDAIFKEPAGHLERWTYKNFGQADPNSMLGTTQVQTNYDGKPESKLAGADGRGVNIQASAAKYYLNTFEMGPRFDGAMDISAQHLVVTFVDGKVASMELLQM